MRVTVSALLELPSVSISGGAQEILELALEKNCAIYSKKPEIKRHIPENIHKKYKNHPKHTIKTVVSLIDKSVTVSELLKLRPEVERRARSNFAAPILVSNSKIIPLQYFENAKKRRLAREEFRTKAKALIQKDEHLFIINAEKIACLRTNPDCIQDILHGINSVRTISLIFGQKITTKFETYLQNSEIPVHWDRMSIERAADVDPVNWEEILDTPSKKLNLINQNRIDATKSWVSSELISNCLDQKEKFALKNLSGKANSRIDAELNALIVKQQVELTEKVRQRILIEVLRETTPKYKSKSPMSPEVFRNFIIRPVLKKFQIPEYHLSEISGNLHGYLFKKHLRK